jgi:DNA (cytosine-5)-methyltransferase 1
MSTITNKGSQQQLVTANMVTLRRNCTGRAVDEPLPTLTAGAEHHALVTAHLQAGLTPEVEAGALRCAAFLVNYYGNGDARQIDQPLDTITTRDRLALVTVWIGGDPYLIVDICLRMLQPHELYQAQGFPPNYIIDRGHDGRQLTKSQQVHMCGNSVSPPPMAAIARANDPWRATQRQQMAA